MSFRTISRALYLCAVLASVPFVSPYAMGQAAEPAPAAPSPPDAGLFPEGVSGKRPDTSARQSSAASRAAGRLTGQRRHVRTENLQLRQAGSDPLEVKIAYRRAETEALRDPRFAEIMDEANRARTDPEKRALLKTYYERLFARIRRIDSSPAVAAHIDLLARAASQSYAPKRILGTEDIQNINSRRQQEGSQR